LADLITQEGSWLELSGLGQPERLRNLGIEVRHPRPGVGETSATITCRAPAG
jgi:hypothetical protein